MCGLSLLIDNQNQPVPPGIIRAMNEKVRHRGPDDEGIFAGPHFLLGHTRLSILDLSQAAHQPVERDDYVLIYNGEIYNFSDLEAELEKSGHRFTNHCDTEVIIPAFATWGTEAFHRFNGMWAFILFDRRRNRLILCRDRFGVKPLFYTRVGNYFAAGSEIKQFTVIPGFEAVLDRSAALDFLERGLLNHSERTLFRDVFELRPGHYMTYDLATHRSEIVRWYDLEAQVRPVTDDEQEAARKIGDLLTDAIRICMRADVPIGSCLSGGIDSSSIVTLIHEHRLAKTGFATITSCYADPVYDEQQYGDLVTAATGYPSIKVYPKLEDLFEQNELDKIIYHHDQPFGSASHYSEYCVFHTAHANRLTVLMDGQGSDEYFWGYDDFFTAYLSFLFRGLTWQTAFGTLTDRAAVKATPLARELAAHLKTSLWHPAHRKVSNAVRRREFPWLKPGWSAMTSRKATKIKTADPDQLSLQQMQTTSIPYQLHSVDRSSMRFSMEVREPFMDYRLIEYVMGLPGTYKIRDGLLKAVLRKAVPGLPEEIRARTDKMGFVAPEIPFMLKNAARIRDELADAVRSTGIFSENLLTRFDRFVRSGSQYEPVFFRAITLNRFCRVFDMKISAEQAG